MSDPDDFQVMTVGSEDGEAVVYFVGELDLCARDRVVEALADASAMRDRLVIDLSRTTFIDSTGLKVLVDVWRRREDADRELVLREPAPVVCVPRKWRAWLTCCPSISPIVRPSDLSAFASPTVSRAVLRTVEAREISPRRAEHTI